jgi:hypothetical protein
MRTMLRSKVTLLFMMLGMLIAIPAVAFASDVDVTSVVDVTAPTGAVSLAPGGSEPITINMSVTGNQVGTATFEVNQDWQLQANGTFVGSNPKEFTVGPRAGGAPATILSTTGTVSVASGVAPAATAKTLTVGVFDITNTNTTGAKLEARKTASYSVTVTAPPPPANTEPQVSVTGVTNGNSYEIGSVPTPGCSVVDAEDTNESANPDVSAITGTLAAYGLGSQTVTCTYTDGGGITRSASVTYAIVDTGNPTITDLGPIAGTEGLNDWYTSRVTNRFEASDTGAGFQTTTPPLLSYNIDVQSDVDQEGNEANPVVLASGPVSDVAGNTAASIDSRNYKIDLNNPTVNITNAPAEGAKFDLCSGALPSPSFTASDTALGSGVNTSSGSFTDQPDTASGAGDYTYKAQAEDFSGRTGSATRKYSVVYDLNYADTSGAFSGVQQPINASGTRSSFKLGSTIPVKFQLRCGTQPINNAVAQLWVSKIDNLPDSGVNEVASTNSPDIGNKFRVVDTATGQYQFNLSTKSPFLNPGASSSTQFSLGTWYLYVSLDDGSKFRIAQIDFNK